MSSIKNILNQLESLPRYEFHGTKHIYNKHIIKLAKEIGKNHTLAKELWLHDILGAKLLAIHIAEPQVMSSKELDQWLKKLNSWGNCDAFCAHLVRETPFALDKAFQWAEKTKEFERRAGFSMIAQLAWKKNNFKDEDFISFLPLIEKYSTDERYYVKKAVNWALRDIGKRNGNLRKHALVLALKLQKSDNKTTKWVGTHRIKEIKNH
ncbi:MAG: DNA alkylation repair protein [Proteobacteria bacterium]|nr:DNA alkylation repair protein [Pseudomonadota bacterium]